MIDEMKEKEHNPKTCKECIWIRKNEGWFLVSNRCTKIFYKESK